MTLKVVYFGRRDNGDKDKKTVREEARGTSTVFSNFYDDEVRVGSDGNYDSAIFSRYTVTVEMMTQLKHVRAIPRFGAGVDAVDPAAATAME